MKLIGGDVGRTPRFVGAQGVQEREGFGGVSFPCEQPATGRGEQVARWRWSVVVETLPAAGHSGDGRLKHANQFSKCPALGSCHRLAHSGVLVRVAFSCARKFESHKTQACSCHVTGPGNAGFILVALITEMVNVKFKAHSEV